MYNLWKNQIFPPFSPLLPPFLFSLFPPFFPTFPFFFSPECFVPYNLRVTGVDEKTDMVVALLCVGLYPNVCYHKDKRRVLTSEGKSALIHKSSVNLINKDPKFPSPYFVFGEKVGFIWLSLSPSLPPSTFLFLQSCPIQLKTRAVAAKTTTMVEPAHLLLFGSSSVVSHGSRTVKMDEW